LGKVASQPVSCAKNPVTPSKNFTSLFPVLALRFAVMLVSGR
tara:strand:+ start:1058 stop:1183 length:126 start_codon:yes stop_codon:yes gene_type:complete